jgi:hypothetical protein
MRSATCASSAQVLRLGHHFADHVLVADALAM